MNLLSLAASVFSSGALGLLGQLGVAALDEWKAGRESARKIAEMRAVAEIKADEAQWAAFTESQKSAQAPANAPSWAAAVQVVWRPFLTLLFFGLATYGFAVAAPERRQETLVEINACAFGLAYWWFGSRYQQKLRK